MIRRGTAIVVVLAAVCASQAGCGNVQRSRADRINGHTIVPAAGRSRLPTEPYSPVDQPGQLPYDDARAPRDPAPRGGNRAARPSPSATQALESAVPPLAEPFDQGGTGAPATKPVLSSGSYMTIGGVVAEVNSVPIYADKLISDLEPLLIARARELSEPQFKELAQQELQKQLSEAINRELLYAAANRLLDDREKKQGELITEHWRQQQITRAGGSIEMARRREAERGRNFEALVEEEYRRTLSKVLLQKQIFPKIQVTAAEMRQYYNDNREKEYTVRAAAQFELIQVDPDKVGSVELAKQRIAELHAKANDGVDFAKLVQMSNRASRRNLEGELPWLDKGALTLTAVEEAVWKLNPGEVTPVIEEGGKFYIARLEQKRPARVIPFEDEEVQDAIQNRLWNAKFRPLYEKMLQDLKNESIVRTDPEMLRSAHEIAMQRYRHWKAG